MEKWPGRGLERGEGKGRGGNEGRREGGSCEIWNKRCDMIMLNITMAYM